MTSGIYQIKNKRNGKLYIGSSKRIEARIDKHKRMLRSNYHSNIHLQRSYNRESCEGR